MQIVFKTGDIGNFAIFAGKPFCWTLFCQPRPKRDSAQVIPAKIAKLLCTAFFMEHFP